MPQVQVQLQFEVGNEVAIACYKQGCEGVSITVTLGQKYEIHPSFVADGHAGRIRWEQGAIAQGFELSDTHGGSGYCNCPSCKTLLGGVVVVSNDGENEIAFGYDPEPA